MRAMIVVVSKSLSVLLSQQLSAQDIKPLSVNQGMAALDMLSRASCDLICVSAQLKDMDGIEFVTRLRKLTRHQTTHVVMLATADNDAAVSSATKAGVNVLFRHDQLNSLLEHMTTWSQQRRLEQVNGRILYVEDNRTTAMLVTEQLKQCGYTVLQVNTAKQALTLLQSRRFDLLMVDYILEGDMSGLELVEQVRRQQRHPLENLILVLSGQEDESKRVQILRSGANDYLDKRASREEMLVRINNLIQTRRLFEQVQHQQEKLQYLAMTDQLTGLQNRHYLFEAAPQKISEAQRHRFAVSLIIMDLDKFKHINDNEGHSAGDEVLVQAGRLLRNLCRKEDIVARYGGEEFVMLLSHCNREQAWEKAEAMRRDLEALKPAGLQVTGSFGIASKLEQQNTNFNELFHAADQALYRAKDKGRNRVEQA